MKQNRVSKTQALLLHKLGFKEHTNAYYWLNRLYEQSYYGNWSVPERQFISAPTVDEAIDYFRRKYEIIVFNAFPPFVSPLKNNRIVYGYTVKKCHPRWGWNQRRSLGRTKESCNIYAAKRMAIAITLKYLKNENKDIQEKR